MALWKDQVKPSPSFEPAHPSRDATPATAEPRPDPVPAALAAVPPAAAPLAAPAPARDKARTESLIAPEITIEGKIEGAGHVRIAGRFKGDVHVDGDLTIEPRATVNGSVRAERVIVSGELVGNIESAVHVELTPSAALTGDLKAGTVSVAPGSRMRGHADFGWDDSAGSKHHATPSRP